MPGIYQTLSDFEFNHRHLCFSGLQKDVKIFINLVGSECSKMEWSIMAAVFGYDSDAVRYIVRNWHFLSTLIIANFLN